MSRFRHKHASARLLSIGIKTRANGHHTAKLTVGACFGRERNRWHVAERHQPMRQLMHQL